MYFLFVKDKFSKLFPLITQDTGAYKSRLEKILLLDIVIFLTVLLNFTAYSQSSLNLLLHIETLS